MKVDKRVLLKNMATVLEIVAEKNDELALIFGNHINHDPNDCAQAMMFLTLNSAYANLCNIASMISIILEVPYEDIQNISKEISKRSDG